MRRLKGLKHHIDTLTRVVEGILGRFNEHNRDVDNLATRIDELDKSSHVN